MIPKHDDEAYYSPPDIDKAEDPPNWGAQDGSKQAFVFQDLLPSSPNLNKLLCFRMKDTARKSIYVQNDQHWSPNVSEYKQSCPPERENIADQDDEISMVPSWNLDAKQFPIILGIKRGYLCLSVGIDQQPFLQIEEKNIMDLYHSKEESKNFTFYMRNPGVIFKLESAMYPGWFICSSLEDNKPITLTNHPEEVESVITDLYFQPCYKPSEKMAS
ncbi:interleukin-36 receptor antagonist protein-like [Sarcophilus harrisii]